MSDVSPAIHHPIYDGFCIVGAAILLGPPIGGFVLGVGTILLSLVYSAYELLTVGAMIELKNGNIFTFLLLPFIYALWSYVFGFFPALGASVAASLYAARYKKLPLNVVLFFVFVACALFAAVTFLGDEWSVTPFGLLVFCLFTALGFIAAFLLMAIVKPFLSIAQNDKVVQ